MNFKKIVAGMSAMAIASTMLTAVSAADVTPVAAAKTYATAQAETTALKTWTAEPSDKSSAWAGGFDADPYAVGGEEMDLSGAAKIVIRLKTKSDNLNGSFGGGIGASYTWASAEWNAEDDDLTPVEGKEDTYEWSFDVQEKMGGSIGKNAGCEFKVNGFNRTGEKKNWQETTVELTYFAAFDADGNAIVELGDVPTKENPNKAAYETAKAAAEAKLAEKDKYTDETVKALEAALAAVTDADAVTAEQVKAITDATAALAEKPAVVEKAPAPVIEGAVKQWGTTNAKDLAADAEGGYQGEMFGDPLVFDTSKYDVAAIDGVKIAFDGNTDFANGKFGANVLNAETGKGTWVESGDVTFDMTAKTAEFKGLIEKGGLVDGLQLQVYGMNAVKDDKGEWQNASFGVTKVEFLDKDGKVLAEKPPVETDKYDLPVIKAADGKDKVDFWNDAGTTFIDTTKVDRTKVDKVVIKYKTDATSLNAKLSANLFKLGEDGKVETNSKGEPKYVFTSSAAATDAHSSDCVLLAGEAENGVIKTTDDNKADHTEFTTFDSKTGEGTVTWSGIIKAGGLYNPVADPEDPEEFTKDEGDAAYLNLKLGTMNNPVVDGKYKGATFAVSSVEFYDADGKLLKTIETTKADEIAKITPVDQTDVKPPVVVTTVTAPKMVNTTSTNNTVKVRWKAAAGVDGYEILTYCDGKKVKTTDVKKATVTTVTGLKIAKNYLFGVKSYKMVDGKKVYSKEVGLKASTLSPAPKITVKAGKNSAKISWKKISNVTKYEVYMKVGKAYKKVGTTKNASFTKKGLKSGVKYSFKVKAVKVANFKADKKYGMAKRTKVYVSKPSAIKTVRAK